MPTARKETAVQELRERLAASPNLFLTDYKGLTVEDITKLRGELRKDGNSYAVVKNTLFRIAAGDIATQLDVFAGPDAVAPAKALRTFAEASKKLSVKAAWIDGRVAGAAEVDALSKLPPRVELLARLVGSVASPLRGLLTVLNGNQSGLVRALNAIREQKAAASNA
jgi:large subunit ribosomal protein L10